MNDSIKLGGTIVHRVVDDETNVRLSGSSCPSLRCMVRLFHPEGKDAEHEGVIYKNVDGWVEVPAVLSVHLRGWFGFMLDKPEVK